MRGAPFAARIAALPILETLLGGARSDTKDDGQRAVDHIAAYRETTRNRIAREGVAKPRCGCGAGRPVVTRKRADTELCSGNHEKRGLVKHVC
jgi:hypothetical protein